jgi:CPA1 family monovalent cation:H+ antiporter
MTVTIQTLLPLLAVLAAVAILARRLDVAPSILLVAAGVGLALIPGLPRVELEPDFVLLVVLPPFIYSAGVSMSWREFRFNLRPITLLAVGCVIFTTWAVAAAMHWCLGLSWPVGFLIGAIVSPPDVVAPLAIARRLGLPHRIVVVLEGEGLANDATALVLYRFTIAAIVTGTFSLPHAVGTFALIVVGEIAYGIGVGWLSLRLRRWAGDPRVELTLSVMAPYVAYWLPQHLGGSGVIATIATGLYVSWRGPLLIPSATRLQGIFFWDLILYMIEGFIFLVTGLQARAVVEQINSASLREAILATLLTTAVIIVARLVWIFPATYLPRWLIPAVRRRDPSPPWQFPFVIGYTGIRGVVSLAAALAIPLTIANGAPFPNRDLILFVTFGVIVITIVTIGLSLPAVLRSLRLTDAAEAESAQQHEAEHAARLELMQLTLERLDALASERQLGEGVTEPIRSHFENRQRQFPRTLDDGIEEFALMSRVRLELIAFERENLHRLLREGKITDESRRRLERELDLEEQTVVCKGENNAELPL